MKNNIKEGVILKGIGGFYYVASDNETVECKARGRFRNDGITPLPGDRVLIADAPGGARIDTILPRKNNFLRPPVSNLDMLVIVVSNAPPRTDPFLIDRITAIASYKGAEAVVCINKCDLDDSGGLYDIYAMTGIKTIRVSALTGEGIDSLYSYMGGKFSAFTGNSGVGKSSILNALAPGLELRVGSISEKIGRGKHTTRHVELHMLKNGAVIADTPGFSSFDTDKMERISKEDMQSVFDEFRPYLGKCRFTGCSHVKDGGCAVREALSNGRIAPSRYESYIKLYEKAAATKEWEYK